MKVRQHTLPRPQWSANSYWKPTISSFLILVISLFIFGIGDALLVLAHLGSTPWTVFAQGIAYQTHSHLSWITFLIGVIVMITWLPFRQKPGLGTVLNITLIPIAIAITLYLIPEPQQLTNKILFMLLGVLCTGVASAFYLTCHMGAGPRDGLMVGIFQMTGIKIGVIRTSIEALVCVLGWLLGGVVGIGTLAFAFGIGWILQFTLVKVIQPLIKK